MKHSTFFRLALMVLVAGLYFVGVAFAQSATTLVIGTTDVVGKGGLEPADNFNYYGFHVLLQTHESLCTIQPGASTVIADLATSCDPKDVASADGLTYTFTLRSGVTFTDGTPLTAANVVYSIKRSLAINGDSVFLISGVKDVTATGPLTVQFTLTGPDPTFLAKIAGDDAAFILSFSSVTKDANGNDVGVDPNTGELKGTPDLTATEKVTLTATNGTIGTGPYILQQYTPDQSLVLQAYPNYWGCKVTPKFQCPNVNQVIEEHFNSSPALSAALQSGAVDIAFKGLAPADITALQGNPKFVTFQPGGFATSSIRYINFDVAHAPFDDLSVREAIALAVDRDAIVNKVFSGLNQPIYTMVPVGFPGHLDVFPKRNAATASNLLQAAGYSTSNPVEVDLWYETSGHYGTTEPDVAAVIKDSLSAVPELKVVLQPIDFGGLIKGALAPNRTINFFLLGWFPDFLDSLDYTDSFIGSGSPSLGIFFAELTDKGLGALPANSTTVRLLQARNLALNAKDIVHVVNELLQDATVTADPSIRAADFETLQQITADVVPQIPLFTNAVQFITLAQNNIGGVVFDPLLLFRDWLITKS